ncbi:hypothetical protein GCM10022233_87320 [Streptomyces shaanxiensis]|uniref:Uncharacterized protein n=1 Tax=Streptomyces shaanxiensis TaxID=653357 RepID=A0ABP7WL48_9ACTN
MIKAVLRGLAVLPATVSTPAHAAETLPPPGPAPSPIGTAAPTRQERPAERGRLPLGDPTALAKAPTAPAPKPTVAGVKGLVCQWCVLLSGR